MNRNRKRSAAAALLVLLTLLIGAMAAPSAYAESAGPHQIRSDVDDQAGRSPHRWILDPPPAPRTPEPTATPGVFATGGGCNTDLQVQPCISYQGSQSRVLGDFYVYEPWPSGYANVYTYVYNQSPRYRYEYTATIRPGHFPIAARSVSGSSWALTLVETYNPDGYFLRSYYSPSVNFP